MLGRISLDIKVDMKVSKFLGMHPLPKKNKQGVEVPTSYMTFFFLRQCFGK
jgi:hypothetical protein